MSVRIMHEVFEHASELKGDALVVLLSLADWCNDDGECWPSMTSLAKKARVTANGASGIMARLQSQGYVRVLTKGLGRGNLSRYKVYPRGDAPNDSDRLIDKTPTPKAFSQKANEIKPQRQKPFVDDKTPTAKAFCDDGAYKAEPSIKQDRTISVCGENAHAPRPGARKLLIKALCEVSGANEAHLGSRDNQEIHETLQFLDNLGFVNDEAAAAAVRELYTPSPHGVWEYPSPPRLSQIRKDWNRQELILKRRNGATGSGGNGELNDHSSEMARARARINAARAAT